MTPSEKKLYNHLYYQKSREKIVKSRDSGNISKAILNLEAIYNEVSSRHLQSPSDYSKMILENLDRPIKVLNQYKELKDKFDRRIDYMLNLIKASLKFIETDQKKPK